MKKETNENIQEQSSANEKKLEEQRISFSAKLVMYLEERKKSFNKGNKASIKIEQLKEIYKRGACLKNEDLNLNGLARVNMFLRMKEQKMMGVISAKISRKDQKLSELVLETAQELQDKDRPIDISESWAPQEEDLEQAKADIENHELDFDFRNVDELYLEPYKQIQLNWE
jgi:hypothetical protein